MRSSELRMQDLRMGNYIQTKKYKTSYEIEYLTNYGYLYIKNPKFEYTDDDGDYPLTDYEPIPLTEDWLIKFGFERTKKTFVDGAYAVTFSRNKDGGWAIYDTSIDEGTNYLTPNLGFCEHVHQLQNLYFALTGEELTIKE